MAHSDRGGGEGAERFFCSFHKQQLASSAGHVSRAASAQPFRQVLSHDNIQSEGLAIAGESFRGRP
eukprot:2644991-Pyramimonas_sp.AAC.1